MEKSIENQARNFYIFWNKMLGYPGIDIANKLIENFTKHQKFTFGKYKNMYVCHVIMLDGQYITWCLKNLSWFQDFMNNESIALYNAKLKRYYLGGYGFTVYPGGSIEEHTNKGDTYDSDFIHYAINKLNTY